MVAKDGGAAFPIPGMSYAHLGMTLQDWLACKFGVALLPEIKDPEVLARKAYEIADAFIDRKRK